MKFAYQFLPPFTSNLSLQNKPHLFCRSGHLDSLWTLNASEVLSPSGESEPRRNTQKLALL